MTVSDNSPTPNAPATQPPTTANPELDLARAFVRDTGSHIFLTGRAGTGKTTFLRSLDTVTQKRFIVTAPTGVAALNAGGVTLHSFFQLPIGPYLPGMDSGQRQYRFSKEKKKIIRGLDLLVIDEVSMVRADVLDAVDATLRRLRRSDEPFGGVQLLLIGDLLQLPPVVKDDEREMLGEHYESMYFFGSTALTATDLITIELQRIYRQSDPRFIEILNQVRAGRLDDNARAELNQRVDPDYQPPEGCVTLTTHNSKAQAINNARLRRLGGRERSFSAEIDGDFPAHLAPTAERLTLKKGAQVMFVRNDPSADKLYYNGKLGVVTHVGTETVTVRAHDDDATIVVKPIEWKNVKYSVNEEHKEIEQEVVGSFRQLPLKTAWAITIHKSQGLTFDQAVIDAQAAFAHGQVYVALSRCRRLDGLVLEAPIPAQGLRPDRQVRRFLDAAAAHPADETALKRARAAFQQRLLERCFSFEALRKQVNFTTWLVFKNASVIHIGEIDLDAIRDAAGEIARVGENFRRELAARCRPDVLPAEDETIRERTIKAGAWFSERFGAFAPLGSWQPETDNKEIRTRLRRDLDQLRLEVATALAGVRSCAQGFAPERYLRAVSAAELAHREQPVKRAAPEFVETDIEHPKLYQRLKKWREETARENNLILYQVMPVKALVQIAASLPKDDKELLRLKGIGPKTVGKYGAAIHALVQEYLQETTGGAG